MNRRSFISSISGAAIVAGALSVSSSNSVLADAAPAHPMAKPFVGFMRGMGIGGWLTNYKRFNVLPNHWRMPITIGDLEHFDTYITEWDVENIASMEMDHIRVCFDQIVMEEEPGVYRDRTFKLLENFVGWCENHNLNVVLNLHKSIGNYCDIPEPVKLLDDDGLQERFVNMWIEFERRFHHKPAVAFELLNEVLNVDPKKWNDLAERTLKAIRKENPTRKVIIGSTCWNSPHTLPALRLYDDENVIYTFHNYAPHCFTHQRGVLQSGPLYYNRHMAYPSDIKPYREYEELVSNNKNSYPGLERMDKNFMRSCLQPAFDFVKKHPDKLLWCGEFGTIRHAKIEYRENWMRDMISLLKEYGIAYSVWNYLSTPNDGNRFSLVDDEHRKILSPTMLRIIQGKE
ncbi:MAG: cellulase family glycosylhydrolase [Planctomycetia bacterium]|nr:cellulase family glycosylhydrolase [Planctomycetia bacterium]